MGVVEGSSVNIYMEQWEKVAAASVVARKIIIVENCSNSLYPSQPDGACFEIASRWSDAALCGCGRVVALTCPERASVVRASNSSERSARPVSGHFLRDPPWCVGIYGRDLLVQCPPTQETQHQLTQWQAAAQF